MSKKSLLFMCLILVFSFFLSTHSITYASSSEDGSSSIYELFRDLSIKIGLGIRNIFLGDDDSALSGLYTATEKEGGDLGNESDIGRILAEVGDPMEIRDFNVLADTDISDIVATLDSPEGTEAVLSSDPATVPANVPVSPNNNYSNNLVLNSSFEMNDAGRPKFWSTDKIETIGLESAVIRSGKRSMRVYTPGGEVHVFGDIVKNVTSGADHTVSAYVNVQSYSCVFDCNIGIGLAYGKFEDAVIYEEAFPLSDFPVGEWVRISATSNSIDHTKLVPYISVNGGASSSIVVVDDVKLEQNTSASGFTTTNGLYLEDGALYADRNGNLKPVKNGRGSLGTEGKAFSSLNLSNASISENGDLSISGKFSLGGPEDLGGALNILTPETYGIYMEGTNADSFGIKVKNTTSDRDFLLSVAGSGETSSALTSGDIFLSIGSYYSLVSDGTSNAVGALDKSGLVENPLTVYGRLGLHGLPDLSASNAIFNIVSNINNELEIGAYSGSPYGMWLQAKNSTDSGAAYPIILNPLGGNIGVGTSAPTASLMVVNSSASDIFHLERSGVATFDVDFANADVNFSSSEDTNWLMGGAGRFVISDTAADSTNKNLRFGSYHYDNSEEAVTALTSVNTSTGNALGIGGGSSIMNAATRVDIYTAADNQTTLGSVRLTILSGGNVGIGTTAPTNKFQVTTSDDDYIASFINTGGTTPNQGIYIQACANENPVAGCNFIDFRDGSGDSIGSVEGNGSGAIALNSPGSDYAELFEGDRTQLKKGDVLGINSEGKVVKATEETVFLGAFSYNPVVLGNWEKDWVTNKNLVPVGLVGQIKVNASVENGSIKAGDYLTVSSTPGVVAKAVKTGQTVGKALESTNSDGQIMAYVTTEFYTSEEIIRSASDDIRANVEEIVNSYDLALEEQTLQLESLREDVSGIQSAIDVLEIIDSKLEVNSDMRIKGALELDEITISDSLEIGDIVLSSNEGLVYANKVEANSLTSEKLVTKRIEIDNDGDDRRIIGTGRISAGETSTKIDTKEVQENSKIFVTPTDVTDRTLSVTDKDAGDSFKVEIDEASDSDIEFDWFIVRTN